MSENGVHIHQFKDTVVPATCTESGYTLHRCDCGYEYKDSFVPAGKHEFVLLDETPATCVKDGVRRLRCVKCGEIKTFEMTADHEWGDWSTQTVATCTEDGKQIRVCKNCGKVEEKIIPATGHKLTAMKDYKTKRGKTAYFCENCGETIIMTSKSKKVILKLLLFVALPLVLIASIVLSAMYYFIPNYRYNTALDAIDEGNYSVAYYSLKNCEEYKDSKELLENFEIVYGVEEVTYYDEDGDVLATDRYECDKHGNQTLSESRGASGKLTHQTKTQYKYDKNDNITIEVNRYLDGDQNKTENTYDKNGNLTLRVYYDRYGNITERSKYKYDKNDNMIYAAYYDENEELIDYTECTYDKNGNMTSYVTYNSAGTPTNKHEYKYDKNGNLTQSLYYNLEENTKTEVKSKYYDDGTLKQQISYNKDGEIWDKYEYNENGDITYGADYEDGELICEYEYKYKYNEEGNPIKETTYKDGKKYWTNEYEYDENNNLICRMARNHVNDEESEYKYEYDDDGFMTSEVRYRDGEKRYEIEYAAPIILYNPDEENTNQYYW